MAETYRGCVLIEALKDQIAVYDCGSFRGHFNSLSEAEGFVNAMLAERERQP